MLGAKIRACPSNQQEQPKRHLKEETMWSIRTCAAGPAMAGPSQTRPALTIIAAVLAICMGADKAFAQFSMNGGRSDRAGEGMRHEGMRHEGGRSAGAGIGIGILVGIG